VERAIAALDTLERDLLAALDAGDVDRVAALVASRGEALASLQDRFQAADPSSRRAVLPELERLARSDARLQARCRELRDDLHAHLRRNAPASQRPQPVMSGVFDRQA